jgi:GT2 family glycosyltransferase
MSGLKLCVMLACFNRKLSTLECLRLLFISASQCANLQLSVYLLDDGSSDGTAEAVAERFPSVRIIRSEGGLFWNRAMYRLFELARNELAPDFYLMLNDDTMVRENGVQELLTLCQESLDGLMIAVGAICDPESGAVTYSGLRRFSSWRSLKTYPLPPSCAKSDCDTFNANFVMIPSAVVNRIGVLDPFYEHGMGDLDYGFRASSRGIKIRISSTYLGTCARNPKGNTFEDSRLPFSERWRLMRSPKGLPVASWFRLTSRHGGVTFPLIFVWPYLRVLLSSIFGK